MQTCVVHLVRAATGFVSYTCRQAVSARFKTVCVAPSVESSLTTSDDFEVNTLE
ncbi:MULTISPECIES: transposase [unclassified Arthrobacter]|uniref:transposase n=1 Tax=unclassified Arthrobacter TaxID=235627 RepID=UPI0011B06D3C